MKVELKDGRIHIEEDGVHLWLGILKAKEVHSALTAALGIGWQPIETAPKDGSLVDLWCLPRNGTNPGRMADCLWDRGSWRMLSFMSDGSPGPEIDMEVTHWMPLAAAPASPEP